MFAFFKKEQQDCIPIKFHTARTLSYPKVLKPKEYQNGPKNLREPNYKEPYATLRNPMKLLGAIIIVRFNMKKWFKELPWLLQ